MSDWKGRLEAVATLGAPKVYADGEVECLSCHNRKLNRADLTCWKCGADRFLPASEEMRHALRFNYVPPPRMVEAPKAEPPNGAAVWCIQSGGTRLDYTLPPGVDKATQQSIASAIASGLMSAEARRAATLYPLPQLAESISEEPRRGIVSRIADFFKPTDMPLVDVGPSRSGHWYR